MASKEFSASLVQTKIIVILKKREQVINEVREERIQWRMSLKKRKWFGLVSAGHYTREEAIEWFSGSGCSAFDPYWMVKWECSDAYDRLESIKKMIEAAPSKAPGEMIRLTDRDASLVFYFDEE